MKNLIIFAALSVFARCAWADDIQSQIQAATNTVDAATALIEHIGLLLAGVVAISAHARALIPPAAINPAIGKALDAAGGNYGNAKNNNPADPAA